MKSITLSASALLFVFSCLTTVGFASTGSVSEWSVDSTGSTAEVMLLKSDSSAFAAGGDGLYFTKNACQNDISCRLMYHPLLSHVGKRTGFESQELFVEDLFNEAVYADNTEGRFMEVEGVRIGELDCYFLFTHKPLTTNPDYGYVDTFCIGKYEKKYLVANKFQNLPINKYDFTSTIGYLRKETNSLPAGKVPKTLVSVSKDWRKARSFLLTYKTTQ